MSDEIGHNLLAAFAADIRAAHAAIESAALAAPVVHWMPAGAKQGEINAGARPLVGSAELLAMEADLPIYPNATSD